MSLFSRLTTIIFVGAVLGSVAGAAGITFIGPNDAGYAIYQQTNQNPCVIGDNPCGPDEPIPYTTIGGGGNINSYDVLSPLYTVLQIRNVVGGNTFLMGLDLNDNRNDQEITLISMLVNAVEVQSFAGSILIQAQNNGSGFSDVLFSGFDLSPYANGDSVQFRMVMPVVNPGAESLFLVSNGASAVPEPSTGVLIGGALAGLGLWSRRRKR